ncbi:MAG: glycosyltransferase family 2 protein [Leptospira sp.]|nr:glycosyltransferase family 2 protein [Leptospira sp.]
MLPPISACIITLNEEHNIERCLKSLDFCDEIILVDSGSTDSTISIAKKYKANVFTRTFDNYSSQKNFAISLAKNSWILSIDADEEISSSLKEEILSLSVTTFENHTGFFIPRLTYYLCQWIHHSGWYPDPQLKLFNRNHGKFKGGLVHETLAIQGKIGRLKSPVHHYSYRSISEHLDFINKYTTLYAIEKYKKGKRSGVLKAYSKLVYKFWWTYIFRLGFLDGRAGFAVCALGAYYNFLKYLKLFELGRDKELASSLLVVVDPIHNIKSQESTNKNCN